MWHWVLLTHLENLWTRTVQSLQVHQCKVVEHITCSLNIFEAAESQIYAKRNYTQREKDWTSALWSVRRIEMFFGLFKAITPFCSGAFRRTSTSLNSVLEKIYRGSGKMMSREALPRLKWRRDETGPDIKYTCWRRKVSWISAHFVMFVDLKGYEWTWGSKTLSSFSCSWHAVWSTIIVNRQNFGGSDGWNSCLIVKRTYCIFKLLELLW